MWLSTYPLLLFSLFRGFRFNADVPPSTSKSHFYSLTPQLLYSAHNEVNNLALYSLHFLTLYPLSNIPLAGQVSTAWEPLRQEISLYLLPIIIQCLSLTDHSTFRLQVINYFPPTKVFYTEDGGSMFLLRNHGPEDHDTKSSSCPYVWRSADHGLKTFSSRVKWKGGGVGCSYSNA
jgi:hypothetical protein